MEEKNNYLYSNNVNITVSNFDIILGFTIRKMDLEEEVATVVMSPQHAKAMLKVLQENVEGYEKIFGQLNLVPNETILNEIAATKK